MNQQQQRLIISALKKIQHELMHKGMPEHAFGICNNVKCNIKMSSGEYYPSRKVSSKVYLTTNVFDSVAHTYAESWPYFSGHHEYPVPTTICNPFDDSEEAYSYVPNKWTGTYGQMRGAYLQHLLNVFSNFEVTEC